MKARTSDLEAWSRARTASAAPKNRVRRSQGAVFPCAGGFAASAVRIDSMIARRRGTTSGTRRFDGGIRGCYPQPDACRSLERLQRWLSTSCRAAPGTARNTETGYRPARRSWTTGPCSPMGALHASTLPPGGGASSAPWTRRSSSPGSPPPRRAGPPGCAAPLLLEERQVAARAAVHGEGGGGFLGDVRLSHARRSLEGGALLVTASAAVTMDAADRRRLNLMQKDVPLVTRPFAEIGERIGMGEDEVLSRSRRLKEDGIIRQISAILVSRRLGYSSTLVAMDIPEEAIEESAGRISEHPGVSHNYKRDNPFNLWFTLTLPPGSDLEAEVQRLTP